MNINLNHQNEEVTSRAVFLFHTSGKGHKAYKVETNPTVTTKDNKVYYEYYF